MSSLLIAPIRDAAGNVRAVLQLVNKCDNVKITEEDATEIKNLIPCLGKIFACAEQTSYNQSVCTSVHKALHEMQHSIFIQIGKLAEDRMHDIHESVENLRANVDEMIATKCKYDPGWPHSDNLL